MAMPTPAPSSFFDADTPVVCETMVSPSTCDAPVVVERWPGVSDRIFLSSERYETPERSAIFLMTETGASTVCAPRLLKLAPKCAPFAFRNSRSPASFRSSP